MPTPAPDAERNRSIRLANLSAVAQRAAEISQQVPGFLESKGFNGRWTRRHWAHASLFATLGALVVALVPGFSSAMQPPSGQPALTTMALALPPLPTRKARPAETASWQQVTVQAGQTLGEIFADLDIPAATLQRILEHPSTAQALARIRPGTEFGFDLASDGRLRGFRFDRGETERVQLSLAGSGIREQVIERPVEIHTTVVTGEIRSSLYGSARQAGLSPKVIHTLTDGIFQYDIDFSREIQPGDRYSVVIEELWREGEKIGNGEVLAATFSTGGKTFSGFRFERDGKAEYFTADGRPLKKSFLRMPVEFARLSSRFGARRHPVLGSMRMHKGVDYAAGTGTPIKAAGDARVQFRGTQRGYGNVVILDHGRGYTTLYAHMSRFSNVRQGQRVSQGEVIGYVGATGLATGPHLHYEFRVNGVHRNPLSQTMPPPEPLKGAALAQFKAQAAPALARIQQVETLRYAQLPEPGREVARARPPVRAGERG
ncbi:peptidoglycan DD-metalloendopeptidase family protein [Luteimonas sp. SJ-92]|uniref:Peptidoglycan DD-metalloendopeptidase family protein n=1 Tax=Luteimonas salinisoli TaxID=2752307 RepID=A0A853J990_9GAMM|nr:peptidoglycan DD-metalloendopeptidase family protein [Luteimonas salinisoli]NZA25258.1 peptidoglycan DD-metalloendopeptidase family protein [Luteimonas salinisoli]